MRRLVPRRPSQFALLLLALALFLTLSTLIYRQFFVPPVLSVAVGPQDGDDARLMAAFRDALARDGKDIRLRLIPTDGARASGEMLQEGNADLAVVRTDAMLPARGLTVAILREEPLYLLTAGNSGIDELDKLARKRIGIIGRHEADAPTIEAVLKHYDLGSGSSTLVRLAADELDGAFDGKRIDAAALIASPFDPLPQAVVRAASRAGGGKVHVLAIKAAESLALKNPGLVPAKIAAGSLSGRPPLPAEDADSVGASHRLVARADLERTPVSKVAQYLFKLRLELAQAVPAAVLMKAPDADLATSERLPVHQGAIDYFNREQLTFMDQYGDWVWLLVLSAGGLTSGIAWLVRQFVHERRQLIDLVLNRLLCMLTEAREAKTVAELDTLSSELDDLVTHAIRHARWRTTSTRTMSAVILAIDSTRAAVADRRHQLLQHSPQAREAYCAPPVAAAMEAAASEG
jgi:TRAP-type uncharacterized transport system substrate-binding protein